MASFHINFTKAMLNGITPPEKSRDYYYDEKESGLVLQVTGKGTKTFYLYRRIGGRPERVLLGRWPDLSIEKVRSVAQAKKGQIAVGKNPQNERRSIRDEHTFKELFHQYMERYSKPQKRSWKYDEREVNKYLSHWFNRKISSISKEEIYKLHLKIGNESGIYQANRILERVRAIFNKAIEWGWEGNNPSEGIKKFKEKSRDRFILPEEMKRFMEALEQEANAEARDFIKLALFTGARKTNILQMRWDEISFELKQWRIPDTKNGEPVIVPLSTPALELLEKRARLRHEEDEWVLPGTGKAGHLADPKKAWARILENSGIEDLRMHDLRRTFGSYQAISGASGYIIGKSLGHKSAQSTEVYARLNLDPLRAYGEMAVQAMLEASNE